MPHVFISYAHDENEIDFIDALIGKIERAGFDVWIDTQQLNVGQIWREEIDNAIKNSIALIVVMTPKAKGSEYVTYEWAFALGCGVEVLPILRRPTEKPHPRLEPLQYLNFTSSRPWDQLVERLRSLIAEPDKSATSQQMQIANSESTTTRQTKALLSTLQNEIATPALRIKAAQALADMQPAAPISQGLITILLDSLAPSNVRAAAAQALGKVGDADVVPFLITALSDQKPELRKRATGAIEVLSSKFAFAVPVTKLISILENDPDSDVRFAAITALGSIQDEQAIPALQIALNDQDFHIAHAAYQALVDLGTPEALSGLNLADYDDEDF